MQPDVINQLSSRQVNPQMYHFQLTVSFSDYTVVVLATGGELIFLDWFDCNGVQCTYKQILLAFTHHTFSFLFRSANISHPSQNLWWCPSCPARVLPFSSYLCPNPSRKKNIFLHSATFSSFFFFLTEVGAYTQTAEKFWWTTTTYLYQGRC